MILSTHTHDDLGMAVANTLAGIRGGARQVECAINGIGERAGNAALEEVVMAIYVRKDALRVHTDIRKEELYASSQLLTRLTGVAVQRNKAIVGRNAFSHEAGIHQDGVLKNAITYEIITPQTVGLPSNQIVLGKHSGRHALAKRYEETGLPVGQARTGARLPIVQSARGPQEKHLRRGSDRDRAGGFRSTSRRCSP